MSAAAPMSASTAAVSAAVSAAMSAFMSAVPMVAVPMVAVPMVAVPMIAAPAAPGIDVRRIVWLGVSISRCDSATSQARCRAEQRN
ncbi:MAG: hypothetical protein JWQ50_1264 [Caballeronia mineralivorans]|nr:hypothetical protein [Caballeronia mineralivorans]